MKKKVQYTVSVTETHKLSTPDGEKPLVVVILSVVVPPKNLAAIKKAILESV